MTLSAPTRSESRCRGSTALPRSPARRNMRPNSMCLVSLTALSSRARSPRAASRVSIGAAALAVPGVIEVFAHDNRPDVASEHEKYTDETAPPGSPLRPLYDEEILFSGQPVALVVAEEFEIARFAATLVDIEYEAEEAITDLDTQIDKAFSPPKKRLPGWDPDPRGDVDKALSRAPIHIQHEYRTPIEHHNPDGKFRVYGGVGGRWTPHCLRQDARRSELPQICMQHLRPRQREGACFVSLRRRRLRCGPQAKLSSCSWRCWPPSA